MGLFRTYQIVDVEITEKSIVPKGSSGYRYLTYEIMFNVVSLSEPIRNKTAQIKATLYYELKVGDKIKTNMYFDSDGYPRFNFKKKLREKKDLIYWLLN